MKAWMRWLPLLFVMTLAATAISAQTVTGRVVRVSDGDTITILVNGHDQQKIRLAGIDAPEKKQPFGARARQALSEKVFGKDVGVVVETTDRYHRRVAAVYLDNRWINCEMVSEGWAWWYRRYSTSKELNAAEDRARASKSGLWQDSAPEPPWEFRSREKEVAKSRHTTLPEKE